MQGFIVLVILIGAWKIADTMLEGYRMHLQAVLELRRAEIEAMEIGKDSEESEEKHIGFVPYSGTMARVDDEY